MEKSDLLNLRLRHHGLSRPDFGKPEDVVAHLGAVQAQDFAGAKWSLGLRLKNGTDEIVEKAFADGSILRTHVMRPTWHFITPEDIRPVLALTSARVHARNAPTYRKLGLGSELLGRCRKIFEKALPGRSLTRKELGEALSRSGIPAGGLRLAYIVAHAELEGLLCSGPRRGRQFTYALLDERAPNKAEFSRDEALAKLALKYFSSHGPAEVRDFSWWSGLTVKEAREGLETVKSKLEAASFDGQPYFFSGPAGPVRRAPAPALLLSIYDEYTIAYSERSALSEEKFRKKLVAMGNALTAVMVLDGRIIGTWKRDIGKDKLHLSLNPFRELSAGEKQSFLAAGARYGKFLHLPVSYAKQGGIDGESVD